MVGSQQGRQHGGGVTSRCAGTCGRSEGGEFGGDGTVPRAERPGKSTAKGTIRVEFCGVPFDSVNERAARAMFFFQLQEHLKMERELRRLRRGDMARVLGDL